MSLPERMAKNLKRRFGDHASIEHARVEGGWRWSAVVGGIAVIQAFDAKRRAAQLLLHDALCGLGQRADRRRRQAFKGGTR
jgi:hypothetical protein